MRCRVWTVILGAAFFIGPLRAGEEINAITLPCSDAALAFTAPGRVARVLVREGQDVEAGALLAELDAKVLDAKIAGLRFESENDVPVRAAVAEHAQRQTDAEKIAAARGKGAASALELEHARLEADIAGFRRDIAQKDMELAALRLAEARAEREQLRLESPVAGRVERVAVEVGEAIQALEPAVRVVCVDPLWVEAPVPLATVRRLQLKEGAKAAVRFPEDDGKTAEAEGAVIFVALAADPASETAKVRVAVPNPERRPSGERVRLVFGAGDAGGEK